MTEQNIAELRYWLDLAIKAIIGIVISIVGLDYKAMKNSLTELEQTKYTLTAEVGYLRRNFNSIEQKLERINDKMDKVLTR
jgi:hypothetical protein